jgi:CheY-like chemotaxis protein
MVTVTTPRPCENTATVPATGLAHLVLLSACVAETIKKILVVEDHDECRQLLAQLITRLGYEVFEAATGIEAIDQASTIHPDLIMLDLALPGMNGDETTAHLKANLSTRDIPVVINIPVVIETPYIVEARAKRALDAGAAEILYKPFDLTTLRNVLCRYVPTQEGTTSN